jgi:twitching motility protein PilU
MDRSLAENICTFDQSLMKLYRDGRIDLEEALAKADSRDGLSLKIRLGEGTDHAALMDTFNLPVL